MVNRNAKGRDFQPERAGGASSLAPHRVQKAEREL